MVKLNKKKKNLNPLVISNIWRDNCFVSVTLVVDKSELNNLSLVSTPVTEDNQTVILWKQERRTIKIKKEIIGVIDLDNMNIFPNQIIVKVNS